MRLATLISAAGAALLLTAGAALAAEACGCCKDMAADAAMSCCPKPAEPASPAPAPEPTPTDPAPATPGHGSHH